MLTYADVCYVYAGEEAEAARHRRMLTYADDADVYYMYAGEEAGAARHRRMLTYADVC
jgi:hypothetical protein